MPSPTSIRVFVPQWRCAVVLLWLSLSAAGVQAQPDLISLDSVDAFSKPILNSWVRMGIQPSGYAYTLSDTAKLQLLGIADRQALTNIGLTERVWVCMTLQNLTTDTLRRYVSMRAMLEIDAYGIEDGRLVEQVSGGWFRKQPQTAKAEGADAFGLPVILPPGATRRYWITGFQYGGYAWMGLWLHPPDAYAQASLERQHPLNLECFFAYAVVAVLLFLFMVAVVQWMYIKKPLYGYWAGYTIVMAVFLQSSLELLYRHRILTEWYPAINYHLSTAAVYISQIMFIYFTLRMLQLPPAVSQRYQKLIGGISVYFLACAAVHVAVVVSGSFTAFLHYFQLVNILLSTLTFTLITVQLFRKSAGGLSYRLLLAGSLILWTAAVPAALRGFANIPFFENHFPPYPIIISIGLLGQIFFSTLALTYYLYQDQRRAGQLSQQYSLQLEEQLRLRTGEILDKEALLQEQKLLDIQTKHRREVDQLQQTALQAQMNPHFIFNVLSAINKYILFERNEEASGFLIRFARLMRMVLENSQHYTITLQKELEVLRIYLEIEQQRFGDKMTYTLYVDPALHIEKVTLPPMLLQPYIENAIWHGLLQRNTGGHISVRIEARGSEAMCILIEDNGIGRAAAAAQYRNSAASHQSFGTKITANRLSLLNKVYAIGASVQIEDLTDAAGKPTGTRVLLLMPVAMEERHEAG